jgi:hypothetical protein
MSDDNKSIRIAYDEIDPWIKEAISEYGPDGFEADPICSIDLKVTKVRGRIPSCALTLLFHIDFQDEIFFVAMDWNMRSANHKCKLVEWREELEKFIALTQPSKQIVPPDQIPQPTDPPLNS